MPLSKLTIKLNESGFGIVAVDGTNIPIQSFTLIGRAGSPCFATFVVPLSSVDVEVDAERVDFRRKFFSAEPNRPDGSPGIKDGDLVYIDGVGNVRLSAQADAPTIVNEVK